MANALKRGPLVQLLKSLFTGGADTTTSSSTSSYQFPDVSDVVEGMQSYAKQNFSQFEHHVHGGTWLSHFLESLLVIGVAIALVIVYRDDQKWAKIVSLFHVETTNNTTSEATKVDYSSALPPPLLSPDHPSVPVLTVYPPHVPLCFFMLPYTIWTCNLRHLRTWRWWVNSLET